MRGRTMRRNGIAVQAHWGADSTRSCLLPPVNCSDGAPPFESHGYGQKQVFLCKKGQANCSSLCMRHNGGLTTWHISKLRHS
jgi:hypothetical protein